MKVRFLKIFFCNDNFFQGYEYFGYDPATYYNIDQEQDLQQECSYVIDDGHHAAGDEDAGSNIGDRSDQPLEIDLDHVGPPPHDDTAQCKSVRRSSDQKQILCK